MAKLQKITRANQSVIHSVNIPQDIIDQAKWEKGDDIDIEAIKVEDNKVIVVLKKE